MSLINISSGVTSSGLEVTNGETLFVLNGGMVTGFTIDAGGSVLVSSGGVAQAAQISNGGSETVMAGGEAALESAFGTISAGAGGTVSAFATGDTVEGIGYTAIISG